MNMVMVVVGGFPTMFCSSLFRDNRCLGHKPTFYLLFVPTCTSRRNRILRTSTRTNRKKYCIACSNDVEAEIEIEMENLGKNTRRIEARVGIETPLQAVWDVLTDYEALADFIPGLSQCKLLEQSPNYARLFQVGEQKIGLGLKFNAKGIVDCFERPLQTLPSGALARDIEFEMVQGDFEIFKGKWSIQQEASEPSSSSVLSYSVQVKPKLWLPVKLVEGRLCNEIKINLASIRCQTLRVCINNY